MAIEAGWFHQLLRRLPELTFRYRWGPSPGFDYVSPAVETVTGYTADEFYAQPNLLEALLTPEEIFAATTLSPRLAGPDSPHSGRLHRRDKSTVATKTWTVPIHDASGNLVAIEGLIRLAKSAKHSTNGTGKPASTTATERKQFSDFVQMVAHDIHQSIVTAHVYTGILQKALDRGDVGRANASTMVVEGAIQQLDGMIRDFVDGILTEGSEIRLERQRIDLVEFVAGVVANLAATQKITWIQVEGEEPTVVEADPGHLGRILENLLSNALKYSIAGSPIRLRIESHGSRALLTVSDCGIGIAADDLPRLFQRGFRTRDGARKSSGLGLGLYISRLLAEAHGGRMWAESTTGQGSTFYVELPVTRVGD